MRNHHRSIARVRSLKIVPGTGEPGVQRYHVETDVLVLLPNTAGYHLLGVGSLCYDAGTYGRHQRSSGSTTGPGFLLSSMSRKAATPSASPAEPSPGHGAHQTGRRRRVDKDAGWAYSRLHHVHVENQCSRQHNSPISNTKHTLLILQGYVYS
jgi:hypothetical protein